MNAIIIQNIKNLLGCSIADADEQITKIIQKANAKNYKIDKLEKDFWLTIILQRISKELPDIRFKGGTCLNKVYFPYFRLSEDLDFSLATDNPLVDSNGKREQFAHQMRNKIKFLVHTMGWSLNDDMYHHKKAQGNKFLAKKEHTYLKYVITYTSVFDGSKQTIKIELTYTTKQYLPSVFLPIQSTFIDPLLEGPIFPVTNIQCLDLDEMLAEKCRAAMTRRIPVIRDFFDLWYIDAQSIDIGKNLELIQAKCNEVSNLQRTLLYHFDSLDRQIKTDLHPVLQDVYDFDLPYIYGKVVDIQRRVEGELVGR